MNTPALLTSVSIRPKCSIAPLAIRSAVAGHREHLGVLRRLDLERVGHHRPAPGPVAGDQPGPDALRAAGDDGDLAVGVAHDWLAGSLGCGVSATVSVVIHGSSGSARAIACISAGLSACHRP